MDQHSEQAKSQLFTVRMDRDTVAELAVQDQVQLRAQGRSRPSPLKRRLAINQVIDNKYRILQPIGEGGMGAVFRVFHIQLDKEVALKTFLTDALSDDAWLRFQREAQAIARLNHLNVVKVFDFGVDSDGIPYYTMELLRGRSLAQVIDDEGGFDQKRTISTFVMVARGLAAAHSRGIIHRDIKPGNILLMEDDSGRYEESVKLVDFGIATLVTDADHASKQGESGAIFGSPLYMSPEQFRGDKLTPATDLYSFGCTLFEALTTRPPFFGANAVETMSMHLNAEPPSLARALPAMDVPQRLERLLRSLLAKDVMQRPADFGTVERELLAVLERLETTAAVATRASIQRLATRDDGDDGDVETRSDLLPQSFWNRSVISTIALTTLLVVGVTGGAVVWQKPIKAMLTGNKSSQTAVQTTEIPSDVKPSSVDNSIEKDTYDKADIKFAGEFANQNLMEPEADLDPKLIKSIAPGSFDVSTKDEREQKLRHFIFPNGFKLGKFKITKETGGKTELPANGEVVVPRMAWYVPCSQLAKYPELLDGFKNDSIVALSADAKCPFNDKHLQKIARWTDLFGLDVNACNVTKASIADIKQLHNLSSLGLAYIKVPADQLGQAYDMRKLQSLNLSGMTNVRQLLNNLGANFGVVDLYLQKTNLTDDDLIFIAKLPKLRRMSIRDNPLITDKGIRALVNAKMLEKLELIGTSVTPAIGEIMVNFPRLRKVVYNTNRWDDQQRQLFDSKLPSTIDVEDR